MNSLQSGLSATPAVLTVEIPFQDVIESRRPPQALNREHAEELAGAIADDLQRILGQGLDAFGLVLPAALYDLTEIIRPGLPMVEALFELYRGSLPGGEFVPQIMAIGGDGGRFPVPSIAPLRRPGSGPLLVLPFLFVGPKSDVENLQTRLETLLLEKGRAGAGTESCIQRRFGLRPENLAYATMNDLCALLKIQLKHGELEGLWSVLEAALFRPEQVEYVELPSGNRFAVRGDRVFTTFFTFDQWAATGGDLAAYEIWLKQQRIYESGLMAHGMELRRLGPEAGLDIHCGGQWDSLEARLGLRPDLLLEPAQRPASLAGGRSVLLTEHASRKLGPIAYTVLVQAADGQVLHMGNEYPLAAGGVQAIREYWSQQAAQAGAEVHLAQPGRVVLSEDGRHLMPDLEVDGAPN